MGNNNTDTKDLFEILKQSTIDSVQVLISDLEKNVGIERNLLQTTVDGLISKLDGLEKDFLSEADVYKAINKVITPLKSEIKDSIVDHIKLDINKDMATAFKERDQIMESLFLEFQSNDAIELKIKSILQQKGTQCYLTDGAFDNKVKNSIQSFNFSELKILNPSHWISIIGFVVLVAFTVGGLWYQFAAHHDEIDVLKNKMEEIEKVMPSGKEHEEHEVRDSNLQKNVRRLCDSKPHKGLCKNYDN